MRKLNLPIIKNRPLEVKHLSMDDYLKFVEFNLKYTTNSRKTRNYWRRRAAVKVPFVLK